MKNLLVTGGCGFIGTNFIRYLFHESNYAGSIINVDKLTYAGNPENLADIASQFPQRYHFIQADICDRERMNEVFHTYQIDTVCHFAAESHVDRSITGPEEFIRTNINGTFTLLEIARQHMDRFLLFHHISTDEVYGSLGATGKFTETTAFKPNSPYAASKAASDHLVRAYFKTYNLPITISNCSNNYGPYQFPEKLIPLMILNVLEFKKLPVYGDGNYTRDWLYVQDHCAAVWKIMQYGKKGETYNIGGNTEYLNIELVRLICDLMDEMSGSPIGTSRELITFVKDRPGHDLRYAIDATKIRHDLDWRPGESFESGIRKTIRWYLDHREWASRFQNRLHLPQSL